MNRNTAADCASQTQIITLPMGRDSAEQLLATVQRLYLELTLVTLAARPFLEREIRVYTDRYRACTQEDLSPCSS